ncbi:TPA: hypothetical protein ENX78_14270 [Candidatus Poribacteria bacterium]|nr:hypothetical protein [Candidatus Poribacteria bacterium]
MTQKKSLPDSTDDKEEKLPIPTFIKSEVNFVRLPFFALSRKDSSNRTETEYRESTERDGKRIEILWTVTANAKFGYPTPFDKKVHKAIESIISRKGLPIKNPIDFSIYEICKLLNIDADSGRNYEMVKNALIRTSFAGIQSKGTFYSKNDKRWIEDAFHLYDRIVFIGETLPDGSIAESNYLFLSDWYLKSLNSFYIKPLDYGFFLSLKSNIAGRLYEFLSLQFYGTGGKPYSIDYHKLCQVLPIVEQKYLSKAIQNLESAHEELIKKNFISKAEWCEKPNWTIVYYPGKKAKEELKSAETENQLKVELSISDGKQAIDSEIELSQDKSEIIENLIQKGIAKTTAIRLANNYSDDRLRRQINIFDWLVRNKSPLVEKNPAGFLRKSIEEDYQPPKEYLDQRDKEAKEQKGKDRQERWLKRREKLIRQEVANWDQVSLEERIKGRLNFWIISETMNNRTPTSEQIEIKKKELIDCLPKTDDEKFEYLSQKYLELPPDDFE